MSENAVPHELPHDQPPSERTPTEIITDEYEQAAPAEPTTGQNTIILQLSERHWPLRARVRRQTDTPDDLQEHGHARPLWIASSTVTTLLVCFLVCLAVLITHDLSERSGRARRVTPPASATHCAEPHKAHGQERSHGRVTQPALTHHSQRHPTSRQHHSPEVPKSSGTMSTISPPSAPERASTPGTTYDEEQTQGGGPFSP